MPLQIRRLDRSDAALCEGSHCCVGRCSREFARSVEEALSRSDKDWSDLRPLLTCRDRGTAASEWRSVPGCLRPRGLPAWRHVVAPDARRQVSARPAGGRPHLGHHDQEAPHSVFGRIPEHPRKNCTVVRASLLRRAKAFPAQRRRVIEMGSSSTSQIEEDPGTHRPRALRAASGLRRRNTGTLDRRNRGARRHDR